MEDLSSDKTRRSSDLRLLALAIASFVLGIAWIVAVHLRWL
jgi:hypothetical protein